MFAATAAPPAGFYVNWSRSVEVFQNRCSHRREINTVGEKYIDLFIRRVDRNYKFKTKDKITWHWQ